MDHARVCELLEAKDRIERTLLERGVELDSQGRELDRFGTPNSHRGWGLYS